MSNQNTDRIAVTIRGMAPLLQVFDMPSSVNFYCNVLGFEVVQSSQPGNDFDWGLLRLNGVELMLNTAYEKLERPPVPDPSRIASHSDTAIYFGCPDLDAAYSYLVEKSVDVKPPIITSYGFNALYITDPDGYCLVFHWPVE